MKSGLSIKSSSFEKVRTNHSTPYPSNLTARINGQNKGIMSGEKEQLSLESMSYCSRFEDCSAPKCPLDILVDIRTEVEEDPKCEMAKATRHKYWLSMPDYLKSALKYQGYFEPEYNRMRSARERWNALSEDKKAEIRERMRNVRTVKT